MHLAVTPWLEEPWEELYSWLYEYTEQGGWFRQVGGLRQNQSTPGAETGDREPVPLPENEGTLAAQLDAAADLAGAGITNDGLGGGGELCADCPNWIPILVIVPPMIPWTMNMWVDLGLIPASVLPTSNLATKLQVDQRQTPASILPTSNLTTNLWVVVVHRGFGLVPLLWLEGRCPEVVF
jgi:hypothetical protein